MLRTCRVCGCTEREPCITIDDFGDAEACYWVSDEPHAFGYTLCSACAAKILADELPRVQIFSEGEANEAIRAMRAGGEL